MKLSGNKKRAKPAAPPAAREPKQLKTEQPAAAGLPRPADTADARERVRRATRARVTAICLLAVVALLAAGAAAGMIYVDRTDTIFPNVTVDGIDISGLTLAQTAEKLAASGYGDPGDGSVTVLLPAGCSLTLTAEEVCSETPVSDIALMAWDSCKGGTPVANALTWLRCGAAGMALKSGAERSVDETAVYAAAENAAGEVRKALLESDLSIGEDSIRVVKGARGVDVDTQTLAEMIVAAFREENYGTLTYAAEIQPNNELDLQALYDAVYVEPKDAVYDPETGEIHPETVGVSFDMEAARKAWDAAGYGDEVRIPLITTEPEVLAEELEALLFRDKLAEKTTYLWGSNSNRINNVTRAAASINDTVLLPGQEFSYNPALGERTAENGYELAGAYSGGETVQEYGGGICQVSSTLYYCALHANLSITARTCHMFPVGYLPAGLDATVSWGGPEFRFVNNRDYPIRIVAWVNAEEYTVTVELWGTDVDGSYVEMTWGTWEYFDQDWTEVALGYKAQTYRNVYDRDGVLLSRQPEALSSYRYHDEDIKWPPESEGGTLKPGEVKEKPEETEPPAETEAPAPSDSPEPSETPAPAESPEPEEPVETPAPAESAEPAETPPPADTPEPVETPEPEGILGPPDTEETTEEPVAPPEPSMLDGADAG